MIQPSGYRSASNSERHSMRILFSGVPAYGHLLPLASLIGAALDGGHTVGLVTAAPMAEMIATELPAGVEHLPAGPMPLEFSEETAQRTGANVFQPTPVTIGEIFGGTRLDRTADPALARARDWKPDLILSESFDTVGPLLAAALDIPWYQVGLGPAAPAVIGHEITRTAAHRHAERGLTPVPARGYIDPCPPALQEQGWTSSLPHLPLRPRAHRRPGGSGSPLDPPAAGVPRVLITLGTIFSEPQLLDAVVDSVRPYDVDVVVTDGLSLYEPTRAAQPVRSEQSNGNGAVVHRIPFTPLADLLGDTDIVISAGGSGTVLSSLVYGLPMILWPQGADQEITAARAVTAGVARIARQSTDIGPAVAALLADDSYRRAAAATAQETAEFPGPAAVLDAISN